MLKNAQKITRYQLFLFFLEAKTLELVTAVVRIAQTYLGKKLLFLVCFSPFLATPVANLPETVQIFFSKLPRI